MQRREGPCVDSSPSELNRKILGQKLQWSVVTSHNLNSRNALVDGGITLSADLGEVKCSSVQHAPSLVLFLQVLISRDQFLAWHVFSSQDFDLCQFLEGRSLQERVSLVSWDRCDVEYQSLVP